MIQKGYALIIQAMSASGHKSDYTLDVAGNIGVNGVIAHNDDADTYIQFATNLISFYTGNSGNASNVEITRNLLHVSASANSLTQDILKVDNTVMNRALHLGLTGGNSSIQAKLTNGTTNKLLIQPSGSATEFGGDVSGSATSTGSFGHLVIGSDSTTFKNLSIDQLTTKAAITVDESAGTSNSAVLNLLADRPSDGQDAAEIRMRNNSATSFARIVGVRGSADTYGDLHFRTRNASGLTTRLAIDQDGNVGIGHTAPTELLHVKKSTGDVNLVVESVAGTTPTLHIKSPADRAVVIKFSEGGALKTSIFHGTDDSLNFYLNSGNDATLQLNSDKSIRMYGNVGIGIAPTHNFNLRSTGNVEFRIQSTDDDARLQISSDNDEGQDSILEFLSNTSTRGSILYDHNTTAASQKMDFKVGDNAVTAMTILGDGKVGIGATSIGYKLDVEEGSGNEIARFQGRNSGNIVFRNSTSNEFVMYTGWWLKK